MKTLKDFLSSLDHSYDFLSINLSIDGDIITVVAGDDKLSSDDEWDIMDFAENHNSGFRVCDECGKPFWGGYTDNFDMYCCEYHFNGYMDKNYPDGWRINETGEPGENDGFYDAIGSNSEWYDTGIFYTEW